MNLLRCVCLSVSIAAGGLPALAAAAPFMTAEHFLTKSDEQSLLNDAERARLADIRSRKQVIQASAGACDQRAFSSPSTEMDLPGGRSVVLTRTRQKSSQFPSTDEHGTRIVTALSWTGRTGDGTDAIFSFVDGSMSGQFNEGGAVVSVEQMNTKFCIVIQYDPSKFPPD